jgi:hypothetical protein
MDNLTLIASKRQLLMSNNFLGLVFDGLLQRKLYDPSNYILVVNQSFVITGFPEPFFCIAEILVLISRHKM